MIIRHMQTLYIDKTPLVIFFMQRILIRLKATAISRKDITGTEATRPKGLCQTWQNMHVEDDKITRYLI